MGKIFAGILIAAGWITGQVLIFMGYKSAGATIIFVSLLAIILVYTKIVEFLKPKPGIKAFGTATPALFATLGIITAVFGAITAAKDANSALLMFILSGALLFISKPAGTKLFDFFEIPRSTSPMQKWEPWYVAALFVVSCAIRVYEVGNIPPAGCGGEGLVLGGSYFLAGEKNTYYPHYGGGLQWPSLTFYIGIFFAKIFGWEIAGFRVSSGVLGAISVVALYFLARRLTSPVSAVISTIMYSVFISHVAMSRTYAPLSILFLPHIICLGILLAASQYKKWYLFLAAGLAGGYSLHGYFPGRGVLVLFLGWFLVMFIMREKLFLKKSNFLLFWAGFFLVASPVVYFALRYPDQYWSYVQSVDPNRTGGILSHLNYAFRKIPIYAGIFNVETSWESLFHRPYRPLLDIVSGTLFPAGIFLCAFAFWKPIPSALLILFIGGMVPALLGEGGSYQPNTQRTLLVFPLIFIFCAYAFERIRLAYRGLDNKFPHVILILTGIIASLWSFQDGIKEYFIRFAQSPVVKVCGYYTLYNMQQVIKKHPGANVSVTPSFSGNDAFIVFVPFGKHVEIPAFIDSMLVVNREKDSLVFLGPFYSNAIDVFKKFFPNAETSIVRETKELEKDPFYTTMLVPQSPPRQPDRYVPFVYNSSVFIPKKDAFDFQTMLVSGSKGAEERIRVSGGSDFSEKYAGKKMTLRGAVLVPDESFFHDGKHPIVFNNEWKGWTLVFDRKKQDFNKPFNPAGGGIHYFEISGIVPAGKKGDLPVKVMYNNKDLGDAGRVVAMGSAIGAVVYKNEGPNNWDKPIVYSHGHITPHMRMFDGMDMVIPYSLKEISYMSVPVSGEYHIKGNEYNRFKILINKEIVFDNMKDTYMPFQKKIWLSKDKPAKMELYMLVEGHAPVDYRAITIYVKGPEIKDYIMAPPLWFSTVK